MATEKPVSPLQTLANSTAIKRAEQQYRLATLFTPFGFTPERVDYDRVAVFLDNPRQAFPQPSEGLNNSLARIEIALAETAALLGAFEAQGITPSLTADQLFTTAKANVTNPGMARAA